MENLSLKIERSERELRFRTLLYYTICTFMGWSLLVILFAALDDYIPLGPIREAVRTIRLEDSRAVAKKGIDFFCFPGMFDMMYFSLTASPFLFVGAFLFHKFYAHPKVLMKKYRPEGDTVTGVGEKVIRGTVLNDGPGEDVKALLRKGWEDSKESSKGPIAPMRVADTFFPYQFENRGIYLQGSAGSGKSQVLKQMLYDLRERKGRDKFIIYDRKPEYVTFLYRDGDIIICPADRRHTPWDIFCEAKGIQDLDPVIASLIPETAGDSGNQKFWDTTARRVFKGCMIYLLQYGEYYWQHKNEYMAMDVPPPGPENAPTNEDLVKFLFNYGNMPDKLYLRLAHSEPSGGGMQKKAKVLDCFRDIDCVPNAAVLSEIQSLEAAVSQPNSTVPSSVMSTLGSYIASFTRPEVGTKGWFSIKEWLHDSDTEGSAVFLCNPAKYAQNYQSYFTVILDLAMREMISMPNDIHRRVWFVADEFGSLFKLDSVIRLLAEGRSKGACTVLGTQDMAQIKQLYKDETETLLNNCNSKVFGRVTSKEEAKYVSELVGEYEVEAAADTIETSYGKDGGNITERDKQSASRSTRVALMASEVSRIKDLNYICKFGDASWFKQPMAYYPWNKHEKFPGIVERDLRDFDPNSLIDPEMYAELKAPAESR